MKIVVALLLLALTPSAYGQTASEQMLDSTVRVFCEGPWGLSTGSGFVVGPNHVATNHHVIDCGGQVTVALNLDEAMYAQVVWQNQGSDLAVLEVSERLRRPAVRLVPQALVAVNDDVRAVGFPAAADRALSTLTPDAFQPTLTRGVVSRVLEHQIPPMLQTDASISSGNSGGPLFSTCGDVVGMNTAVALTDNQVQAQGIGFAVATDPLIEALATLGVRVKVTSRACAGTSPPPARWSRGSSSRAETQATVNERPERPASSGSPVGVLLSFVFLLGILVLALVFYLRLRSSD